MGVIGFGWVDVLFVMVRPACLPPVWEMALRMAAAADVFCSD